MKEESGTCGQKGKSFVFSLFGGECFFLLFVSVSLILSDICVSHAQVAVRIPDAESSHVNIEKIGELVWVKTNFRLNSTGHMERIVDLYQVVGDKTKQIALEEGVKILEIKDIGGQAWLATDKGVYRVIEGKTEKVLGLGKPNLIINDAKDFLGQTWLATDQGVYRVEKGEAKQLLSTDVSTIGEIKEIHGQVWLTTEEGAYQVTGDTAKRMVGGNQSSPLIEEFDGQIWVQTEKDLYRVVGGKAKREPNAVLFIWDPKKFPKDVTDIRQVWLATDHGAYRVVEGKAKLVSDGKLKVRNIFFFRDESPWLDTNNGVYRVVEDKAKLIVNDPGEVKEISISRGPGTKRFVVKTEKGLYLVAEDKAEQIVNGNEYAVWATEDGRFVLIHDKTLYRLVGNKIEKFTDIAGNFQDIELSSSGQLWVSTEQGVYRIVEDKAERIIDTAVLRILEVRDIGGQAWLGTSKGFYRVIDAKAEQILQISGESFDHVDMWEMKVEDVNEQIWLMTTHDYRRNDDYIKQQDLYHVTGNKAEPFHEAGLEIKYIKAIGGQLWLKTNRGLHVVIRGEVKRLYDTTRDPYGFASFVEVGEQVWIETETGAYRVDKDNVIAVTLHAASWWKSIVERLSPDYFVDFSGVIKPNIHYVRLNDGQDPYDNSIPREFHIIMETDKQAFEEAVRTERYSPAKGFERSLSPGFYTIHFSVRDKWGNTFTYNKPGVVVPGATALPVFLALCSGASLILVVLFAPISDLCQGVLMNPWARNYGSFGLIPLALSLFPPVRRHVLRRYKRNIQQDPDFAEWQMRFVVPAEEFLPERFGEVLATQRSLLLLGQSGIGKTSYLRYLTSCYTSKKARDLQPGSALPVFLPLARYQGEEPELIFQAQLASYGRLTDNELAASFLQQGGFLIFIDGLNEVDKAARDRVNRFVDQHRLVNYICVSSQERYAEFAWMEKSALVKLEPEKIQELLRRRLNPQIVDVVLSQFTAVTYELYQIPQDLEFAIDLIAHGQPLPQSRLELYRATLAPILDNWRQDGRADYPELLSERAYEMLRSRDAFFDQPAKPLPDELQERLIERKFLVRRSGRLLFRHDLIRGYLAATYFTPRWKDLLKDEELFIDSNWRSMLEFVLLSFESSDEGKDFLFTLLKKNKQITGEVFKWLVRSRPDLSAKWAAEFMRKYGEAMLE